MSIHGFTVGPRWPTAQTSYDYLSHLAHPAWAWEFLRRSPRYCLDARRHGYVRARPLPGVIDTHVSRSRRRQLQAEAWGLLSFRGTG